MEKYQEDEQNFIYYFKKTFKTVHHKWILYIFDEDSQAGF